MTFCGSFSRVIPSATPASERSACEQILAITLFSKGRYSEAWAKVKLAEATPNKDDLDPRFLAALQSRMPQPQN
jgi:hypothetical protein